MACVGTLSSLKKSLAASRRVTRVERAHAGAAVGGAERLVEADVPIAADAQQLDVDAAGVANGRFVLPAVLVELARAA